jgi:serine/threonine-protein kinase
MLEGTPYRIVREIGAGGMGVVYEIEHVRLGKRYVAKVIQEAIKDARGSVERMQREAKVLASFHHPNVVEVHDVGSTADGVHYFVMDKLEGIDLRRLIQEQGVARPRALAIVADVLRALDYVHQRGVVHRDIKPENVFLSNEATGTVTKVLDFGIVQVLGGNALAAQVPVTKTGGFIGTLRYAAPEQLEGKPAGPPSDVYAVGLLLFELLAGRGPFEEDEGVGVARCLQPAPRLGTFVKVQPRLDELVARALERDPQRRPSAAELARVLTAIEDVVDAPPTAGGGLSASDEVDALLRHLGPPAPGAPARPAPHDIVPAAPAHAAPPMQAPPGYAPTAAALGTTLHSPGPAQPPTQLVAPAIGPSSPPPALPFQPSPPASRLPRPDTAPGIYSTAYGPNETIRRRAVVSWSIGAGVLGLLLAAAGGVILHRTRTSPELAAAAGAAPSQSASLILLASPSLPASASPSPSPSSSPPSSPSPANAPPGASQPLLARAATSASAHRPVASAIRPGISSTGAKGGLEKEGYVKDL